MFVPVINLRNEKSEQDTNWKKNCSESLSFCGIQTGTAVLETNLTQCYQESLLYDAIILLTRLCTNKKT